jgi:hypothetical protein
MSEIQEMITRVVAPPPSASPGLHLVIGPYEVQPLVACSLVGLLHDGLTVHWIDAGNWFDAHGISKAARACRLDERRVLANIRLARPFTAVQLTSMLSRKLPGIPSTSPVVLSDPMALFYDHEMPEPEVGRFFQRFIDVVRELKTPVLTLAIYREAPAARKTLSRALLREVKAARAGPLAETSRFGLIRQPRGGPRG